MNAPDAPALEPEPEQAARPQRRLHPMSWMFVLLHQLKEFALPIIALLLFGQGETWQFWGAAAGGVLALVSVVQYFSYRYGVIGSELVIREGILQRKVRHIPLGRIRNVSLHRNVLHRLFGVAEVRLESAAGTTAEAKMRVLSLADAADLEALVRAGQHDAGDSQDAPQPQWLLRLPTTELVRLGLISNRGMVVVGAGLAVLWQLVPDGFGDLVGGLVEAASGRAQSLHLGWLSWAVGVMALVVLAVALLRLLSIALAIVQFHGFTLARAGERLSLEAGLLTRVRAHTPLRKIQHWTVVESLLHRALQRQSLKVETAVLRAANDDARNLNHLAPVATPEQVRGLIATLLPEAAYPAFDWRPLHPRAWRRMLWPSLVLTLLVGAALSWRYGAWGLAVLALLPLLVWRARRLAAACGYCVNDTVIAWRSGWLDRRVSFAEVAKLQGVQLRSSVFDRHHGMATLIVDTAGADPMGGHRIHIPYLPQAQARALMDELGRRIAASALAW
ncbi:MAG TPA: PH domain-containing protein [Xanthomonadaceae bacterium]|nr:PH domain-containing protein [Xanthomonadaceae bacterium]